MHCHCGEFATSSDVPCFQVSLSATQQMCAAGALVSLLHREGAISAPQEDAGPGSRHLLAINSITEVLHAQDSLLLWDCCMQV